MTILYLGLDPPPNVLHYPVIRIVPKEIVIPPFTHIIFTSKSAVRLFHAPLQDKIIFAIGAVTASLLPTSLVPKTATQEGLIELLDTMDLSGASFFWPRSSLSRNVLVKYFHDRKIPLATCAIYDTVLQKLEPVPDLAYITEIVFTSPSTVDGFFQIFPAIPGHCKVRCIGPITQNYYYLTYPPDPAYPVIGSASKE